MNLLTFLISMNLKWVIGLMAIPTIIIWDIWMFFQTSLKNWGYKKRPHEEKVKDVQRQVKEWRESGAKQKMCTGRPGSESITQQVLHYKDTSYKIFVDLPEVLFINSEKRFVRVEPSVTIGKLATELVKEGWTLPIVPELDDLQIGGLVMGGGIEVQSAKYGLFHKICKQYEMVMADGSAIWVSPENNPDLYNSIPFSYGTLGFLTAIDVEIIPLKPYMEITYVPTRNLDELTKELKDATVDPIIDAVEGFAFTLDTGVVLRGKYVDKVPKGAKKNSIGRWYKPWFYTHVKQFLNSSTGSNIEYIPTRDFYHRHTRSIFWLIDAVIPFGNHWLFRYTFGWILPPKWNLLKIVRHCPFMDTKAEFTSYTTQDFLIDINLTKESLTFFDKVMKIYPIWLCPSKEDDGVLLDIGIYGWSTLPNFHPVKKQRECEEFTLSKKGFVALYAETYLTFDECMNMLKRFAPLYEAMRKKYGCEEAFPHVYDKISMNGRGSVYEDKYVKDYIKSK